MDLHLAAGKVVKDIIRSPLQEDFLSNKTFVCTQAVIALSVPTDCSKMPEQKVRSAGLAGDWPLGS